jgi:hypothetical protein
MHLFVPEIGKRVKLSARETRENRKTLLTRCPSCFDEPLLKVHYVNELKHIAKIEAYKNRIADEKKAKADAEAAENERVKPASLREALKRGEKLPIKEWLMATYDRENISGFLRWWLYNILEPEFQKSEQSEAYESLRGKKILDLGCGSVESYVDNGIFAKPGDYEPWLCRALHRCGAKPIGVDIHSNDGEVFEHIQADLSKPGALQSLFDASHHSSFDGIVSSMFLKGGCSPTLSGMTTGSQRREMEAEIMQDALRLLKDGGIFLFEREKYQKKGNDLLLVSTD